MVSLRPRKAKKEAEKQVVAVKKVKKTKKAAAAVQPKKEKAPAKTATAAATKGDDSVLTEFLSTKAAMDHGSKHGDIKELHALIREKASELEPELQGNAKLAYGGFDYLTKSKCHGRWSKIAITVNKSGLTLMVMGEKDGKYLLEHFPKKYFGKAIIGKSCIRFKKLSDLHLDHVAEAIEEAATAHVSIAVS